MPVRTITAELIRNLQSPEQGQQIIRDDKQKGFAVRITATGAISFLMHLSSGGIERRRNLGRYPTTSLTEARGLAKQYRRMHELGEHPFALIDAAKTAPRVRDLWERYDKEHVLGKAPSTAADERSIWRDYVLPRLGDISVRDVSADDVDKLHRLVTEAGAPIRANRMHSSIRRALNLAIRWEWIERNVANGLVRNQETPRERYASPEEMGKLWRALDQLDNRDAADAIALLVLTGARKSEALSAKWADFDLENAVWTKPAATTKQRKVHRVPILADAVELLKRRRVQAADDAVWIFPSHGTTGHLTDIKKSWRCVCQLADLKDFRLHDIRHTFASRIISTSGSLDQTGKLLGHTQAATTLRYAHLLDEPLRKTLKNASDQLMGKQ